MGLILSAIKMQTDVHQTKMHRNSLAVIANFNWVVLKPTPEFYDLAF